MNEHFVVRIPGICLNIDNTAMAGVHPQITRPSRRLYVGNLPVGMGLSEQVLCEFFSQCCKGLGLRTENPVVSVWLNAEQTFGFIEFRGVQDTTLALSLFEGLQLGKRQLRFGRPVDYKSPPPYLANYIVGDETSVGMEDTQQERDNIYNVEPGSPAAMLVDKLKQQQNNAKQMLALNSQAKSNININAYKVPSGGGGAIVNPVGVAPNTGVVNGANIGNSNSNDATTIVAPILGVNGGNNVQNPAAVTVAVTAPVAPMAAPVEIEQGERTRVLMLLNCVTDEDLKDDEEYTDILDDIKTECESHGKLIDINIPRINEPGQGRVFVKYDTIEGAQTCMNKINGRKFGDSIVKGYFFDETKYESKDFGAVIDSSPA